MEEAGKEHNSCKRLRAAVGGDGGSVAAAWRTNRVARAAAGGKDRHSKVVTSRGLRDRRIRLSVPTAIQFYDIQDRLGVDQPSKAIDWLIRAAAAAIDGLPSLDCSFLPSTAASPPHDDTAEVSTSETSKGSVLSLSRSDSRVKARERARDRSASVKDSVGGRRAPASAQAASFTELLTGLATSAAAATTTPPVADHKQQHNSWQQMTASATADYLGFTQPRKSMLHTFASPAPHLANIAMAPAHHFTLTPGGDQHTEMTHFSFLQDHFMPVHAPPPPSAPAAVDYNLNFSMSSALVGVTSRGTLQSNSQPHLSSHNHHHQQLQRLSAPLDAPHTPFLFSPAVTVASPTTAESHFAAAAALQLWDGFRHSDMKEKGKN